MKTITAEKAKENFQKLMTDLNKSKKPLKVKGNGSSVIMLSEEEWRGIQETLYITSVPGLKEKLLENRDEPLDESLDDVQWGNGK